MPLVVAIGELGRDQIRYKAVPGKPGVTNTTFYKSTSDTPNSPSAYIVRYDPGRYSSAHYHENDQFQVIVDGKGKFGRHDVSAYCVHFSRAFTPYGPLLADAEIGWAFLTLRARYDPGAHRFPAAQEKLRQMPDRHPWQATEKITFPPPHPGVSVQDVPAIKDAKGLFVCSLTMGPHTRTAAPNAADGDGQFIVILKGSLVHNNREHSAMTVVFVKPDESAFQIHAGGQGLEGLVLNLPKVKPHLRAQDTIHHS